MKKSDPELAAFASTLEDHPEHLKAIGLLSVELNGMELYLAALLGRLIGVHYDLARAIYFAPLGQAPRLKIIQNAAEIVYAGNKAALDQLNEITGRVQAVTGKRHMAMHSAMGVGGNGVHSIESLTLALK